MTITKKLNVVFAILLSTLLCYFGYKSSLFIFVYPPDEQAAGVIVGYIGGSSDNSYDVSFYNQHDDKIYQFQTSLPHPKVEYFVGDSILVHFCKSNPTIAYIEGEGFFQYLLFGIVVFIFVWIWYGIFCLP